MHRLFVAIRPPESARDQLLDLMEGVDGARWQDDEQLHLTVRFIGEVDRPTATDVAAVLGTVSRPALEIALSGVGHFGSGSYPHALWAGVRPVEELTHLHKKVDQALVRIGLEPERRAYRPHITVARLSRRAGSIRAFLESHAALSSAPFEVDSFGLYESRLSQAGATYELIERYPLQKE